MLTVIVGMTGIVLGTLMAPFLNYPLNQRYNGKELLFKKN
jgi:hypothetical protein